MSKQLQHFKCRNCKSEFFAQSSTIDCYYCDNSMLVEVLQGKSVTKKIKKEHIEKQMELNGVVEAMAILELALRRKHTTVEESKVAMDNAKDMLKQYCDYVRHVTENGHILWHEFKDLGE